MNDANVECSKFVFHLFLHALNVFLHYSVLIKNIYGPVKLIEISQSINQSKLYLPHHFIKNSRPVQSHLHTDIHTYINFILQGAKKVIFTACLNVISGSPQNVLMSRIDFTVLLYVEFLKILHLPVGQVKNRIH